MGKMFKTITKLEGDWSALEGGNFLFRYADLRKAVNRELIREH